MLKNPTDNFRSTHQAIAKRVLASSLGSSIGYGGIGSHGFNKVKAVADGTDEVDSCGWSSFSIEFRRADTNCDISIRTDSKNRYTADREVDADGNQWVQYELSCTVSWPSHGSADVATSMARLNLYQQVAMLAAEIQAEFGGRNEIRKMVATKAEIAERAERIEAARIETDVKKVVLAHGNGMRVGSNHDVIETIVGIPDGHYTCNIGDGNGIVKTYTLHVNGRRARVNRRA